MMSIYEVRNSWDIEILGNNALPTKTPNNVTCALKEKVKEVYSC